MKLKNICRIIALLMALTLWPMISLGETGYSFNRYTLDPEAMKELEKKDTFPVRVIKKVVADGVNSSARDNPDVLSLTVENQSSETVKDIVLLVVAYDEGNRAAPIQGTGIAGMKGTNKRSISVWPQEALNLEAGKSQIINVACQHSQFTGLRALVVEYTDAEGNTYVNDLYEQWQELALGSPTILLD